MAKIQTVVLVLCFLGGLAHAKPFTLEKDLKPYRLDLSAVEEVKGAKAVSMQGVTIDKGHYFYVKGHGMTQPIDVILEAPEDRNLKLETYLSTWSTPVRSGETGTQGLVTQQFTAYGEFGIHVSGPKTGIPYLLTVYAHPEVVPDLGSPFTVQEKDVKTAPAELQTATAPTEKSDQTLIYVVIGLLVVIIALLVVLVLKKRGTTAALLIGTLVPMSLLMQPRQVQAEENAPAEGYDYRNLRPSSGNFEQPPSESSWSGMSTEQADKVWDGGLKTLDYLKKIKEGMDAWEAYQSLDSCMRIASPPNTPLVPSFCAAKPGARDNDGDGIAVVTPDSDCSQCFTDARTAFNKARLDLEKLRVIYSCTKKMSNAALAAGDNMSGVHGYAGVVWQGLRYDISQSVEKMEKAYDTKYPELMKNLQRSMMDMALCEAEFGTPDWYDRVGFIYFEYMSDAYKRKD
ncbi:MAG: hypothetical protein IPM37_08030 [Hahellaceae bacterium]|nr:hypothetical protein [Hahellaceae bacterium]